MKKNNIDGHDDHQSNTPQNETNNFRNYKNRIPNAINSYLFSNFVFNFSFENPKMRSNHIALLFWFLERTNRSGWKLVIDIPSDWTMEAAGIGNRNTLKKCYNDLIKWGFINWRESSKNQYTTNRIELCRTNYEQAPSQALTTAMNNHCISNAKSSEQALHAYTNNINIKNLNIQNNKTIKMELFFEKNDFENFENLDPHKQSLIKENLQKILRENFNLFMEQDFSEKEYEIRVKDSDEDNVEECQIQSDLESQVLNYFGINELNNYRLFAKVRKFLNFLGKQTPVFEQNFWFYSKYKEMTGEHIHSLERFIGTPEENYQDGAWCSVNYKKKLRQFENNQKKKLKNNPQASAKNDIDSGKMDVLNRFFNQNEGDHEKY
jgi:hypothetical protein